MERYQLHLMGLNESTRRRTDLTVMTCDREEGQVSKKFKKMEVAFLVEEDGSITLLKPAETVIKVRNFGAPLE